jgi:formylglycine-generating enzyme required for sulfatase activity
MKKEDRNLHAGSLSVHPGKGLALRQSRAKMGWIRAAPNEEPIMKQILWLAVLALGTVLAGSISGANSPSTQPADKSPLKAAAGPGEVRGTQAQTRPAVVAGQKAGEKTAIDLGNGVNMDLAWIPPTTGNEWKQLNKGKDTFTMGSPAGEAGRKADETQHEVKLTKGFWMGMCEVTQKQWEQVMGSNPSQNKGKNLPVDNVSWNDCQGFTKKLNEAVAGGGFRLPTEAEWEYACRAGTSGAHPGKLDEIAWYDGNSPHKTSEVGLKKPNAWGLYDVLGNAQEWCQDSCDASSEGLVKTDTYANNVVDPLCKTGASRIQRGGDCVSVKRCRSASRFWDSPDYRKNTGVRLVREAP